MHGFISLSHDGKESAQFSQQKHKLKKIAGNKMQTEMCLMLVLKDMLILQG